MNTFKKARLLVEDLTGVSISQARPRNLIVNEAIDIERKIIFIAITKTGTTSVRTQLGITGDPIIRNQHLNILQIRDLIYPFLLKVHLGTNNDFPNTARYADADLRKMAVDIYDSCFKFSAVRNPWARAVSLYFRGEGMQLGGELTFEEFCANHTHASDTCQNPTLHKNQLDWLCDENGVNQMDYTYKVEDFEGAIQDIKELSKGTVVLENVNRNKNPHSKSRDYRDMYNDNTKAIIAKQFEKDIDTFKYSF